MTYDYSKELIDDYEKLLDIDKGHDVIIYAGENENAKEIRAHSIILCIRSQYFRAAFSNEWADKKDGKFILKKSNISPHIFEIILRFIYCGKVNLEKLAKLQTRELLDLLIAVDELNIQTLITCIQEYLIDHHYRILHHNPIEALETVYQLDTFSGLFDFFLEAICDRPEILFNTDNLIRLRAPLLESLLKRDDLLLDEIVIWDNLISWSFAQHPSIQRDIDKWNKEEIAVMKSTLQNFIPLIRFYQISSDDFHLKVYPFKVLLPEDLTNNILASYTASTNKELNNDIHPPRSPKYDTFIIKSQHFAIFSSWIDKKNDSYYNLRNIPYYFKLIYRASIDGAAAEVFHKKCDNKGATIVVAKVKNSNHIFGGYSPLDWDLSNSYKSTLDSFIFTFTNKNNVKTAEVGYSNGQISIGCYRSYGPIFGYYLVYLGTNWWIYYGYSGNYPSIKIQILSSSGNIDIDDYEVFQVIKK
ncbi:unnamed protein product [Rhizophagus irregularis]|nr:unnamed protein product [Rhizophagus irregularis]